MEFFFDNGNNLHEMHFGRSAVNSNKGVVELVFWVTFCARHEHQQKLEVATNFDTFYSIVSC